MFCVKNLMGNIRFVLLLGCVDELQFNIASIAKCKQTKKLKIDDYQIYLSYIWGKLYSMAKINRNKKFINIKSFCLINVSAFTFFWFWKTALTPYAYAMANYSLLL